MFSSKTVGLLLELSHYKRRSVISTMTEPNGCTVIINSTYGNRRCGGSRSIDLGRD